MSQHRRRPFSWQEPASTAREHLYGDQDGRDDAQDRPYLGRTRSMAGRRPSATPPWSPVIPEAPGRTPSTAHALGAPGWVYHQAQSEQDLLWSVEDDSSPEPSLAGVNHLPRCHTIHIPLRLGPWSDYRTLQLCLHPDWILEPDAVFHLVRNSVSQSSQRPPHPPALESTHYEPADLWSHHVGPLDSPASTRATSVCLDPAPTRSTTKSPSPAETEIEYGTTERQAEARDGGFDGSTAVGVWAVSMLVLLASLMAYVVTFQGHPAWVKTSSVNETWPISLWDLYDSLQTDYEHVLVPLVIPFQTTDPAPDDFHSIIAALKLELSEVGFGITSWNVSRAVPGPASISLARRTELAIQALNAMSKTWMSLVSWTDALTGGIGSRVLTVTLREIAEDPDRSEQEKARASLRSINGSVSIIAQRNHDCLMTLKSIDENLRSIGPELDFILSQVGQGIRPHIHLQNYNRGWIIRTLDAVDYSSQYLVPIFQLLSRHVDKAIVRLSAANTTLASHREHYELVTATGGVADRTSMRYSSDTQTKWSSWFLKEETAKIQYVLENKTINELFLVAQRSAEMRQFLKTGDEEWNYYKIRPQRPPLH